jgi:hypothetical protein
MILYKYLAPDRIDVLRNRLIRFTQPRAFNDPFEFRPAFGELVSGRTLEEHLSGEAFERRVSDALKKAGVPDLVARAQFLQFASAGRTQAIAAFRAAAPGLRATLERVFEEQMSRHVGVLCLSEVRDSALMWGHYTDCHRGFVIGLDDAHPFFSKRRSAKDEFGFLRKVLYRRDRPDMRLDTASESISADLFQTKSQEWEYEREWRMMRALDEATKRIPQMPYDICLFDFDPGAVREIIVGMRAEASLFAEIHRLALLLPQAALLVAREHPSEYSIQIEAVR